MVRISRIGAPGIPRRTTQRGHRREAATFCEGGPGRKGQGRRNKYGVPGIAARTERSPPSGYVFVPPPDETPRRLLTVVVALRPLTGSSPRQHRPAQLV